METTKIRIKKEYSPITVYTSVVIPTNGNSTLLQTYKASTKEYVPNRNLTPTTIMPRVLAYSSDGSLKTPYAANASLVLEDMHWYVDGEEISTVWTEGEDYKILTVGSDRGGLMVYRNISTVERHQLHFEGVILDERLPAQPGSKYACQSYDVKTNDVVLRTTDLAEFEYKLSVGCDPVVHYNPFTDPLLLFEHKEAHGIEQTITEAEAKADELSYLRNIPIVLFRGEELATDADDFTVKLYRIESDTKMTEITPADDNEVLELDKFHILLDMRMIELENYSLAVFVRGEEQDRTQFAVRRLQPKYSQVTHANQTGITPTARARYDYLTMEHNGEILECPGLSLEIIWLTTTAYKKDVVHNEGEETLFSLDKTGIGSKYDDDWLEIDTQISYKPAYDVAVDEDGDVWTDENGNPYIFN